MRQIFILTSLILVVTSCVAAGIDAPLTLDEDYLAREAKMIEDIDQCGPEFIQEKLPASVAKSVAPITDGPFGPVCKRHDGCYRLKEKDQSWCDTRMKQEMMAICASGKATAAYSVPVVGPALCRFHATLYYAAINNTFAAVAHEGLPGGRIVSTSTKVIHDRLSDDEFTVCALVENDTKAMQEYDIEMHSETGRLIDREPDTYEVNIKPGAQKEFCVSTNYSRWGISDLGKKVHISIRADTPQNFAWTNDMIIVDTVEIVVPQP